MVKDAKKSDVLVLKCKDGVAVHASRKLLADRSPVFKSMLTSGRPRAQISEIPLVKFSSPVMLSTVEYLHMGSLKSHPLEDWRAGLEMLSAAQFFMIHELKSLARGYLVDQIKRCRERPVLLEMLSVAVEIEDDWNGRFLVLWDLNQAIGPEWCEEDSAHKLSRRGVEFMLSQRNQYSTEKKTASEYLTFRKIVLWHVYQAVPKGNVGARRTLDNILPGGGSPSLWQELSQVPVDVDKCVSDLSAAIDSFDSTAVLNSMVGTSISKESLEQMLGQVKLWHIPATLLLKVIHPLKTFPPEQMLKALLQRSLEDRMQYSVSQSDWKHGSGLEVYDGVEIICGIRDSNFSNGSHEGMAIALVPMQKSNDTYEWSFKILNDLATWIDLGFICGTAEDVLEEGMLEKTLRDVPSSRVLSFNPEQQTAKVSRREPKSARKNWKSFNLPIERTSVWLEGDYMYEWDDEGDGTNPVVTFKLDKAEKTCAVRYRDSFLAEWKDLPDGDFYPAVAFEGGECATVRLTLLSGFDHY